MGRETREPGETITIYEADSWLTPPLTAGDDCCQLPVKSRARKGRFQVSKGGRSAEFTDKALFLQLLPNIHTHGGGIRTDNPPVTGLNHSRWPDPRRRGRVDALPSP